MLSSMGKSMREAGAWRQVPGQRRPPDRGTPVMNTAREYLTNLRVEAAVYESDAAGWVVGL